MLIALGVLVAVEAPVTSDEPAAGTALLEALRTADLLPAALSIESGRLVTARSFAVGETLLELAQTSALDKDSAQDTALLPFVDPEDGRLASGMPHWAALPDEFALAMQLLLLMRGDGPARPVWDAWLRLASLQLRGTSHWSEEERGFLAESHMQEHADAQPPPHHALLELLRAHDAAFFDERSFSAEALDTATSIVRAHSVVPPQTGNPLLLPLPQLRLEYDATAELALRAIDGRLQLRARHVLPAGTELTLDAAGFGHAALMARQGTPGDGDGTAAAWPEAQHALSGRNAGQHGARGPGVLRLSMPLAEDDAMYGLKQVLLSKWGLSADGRFELRQGAPPPARLLPFARLVVLQEHELPLLPTDDLPREPLGASNEDNAFRLIAVRVELRLAAYPSTLEEDEYALQQLQHEQAVRRPQPSSTAAATAAAAAAAASAASAAAISSRRSCSLRGLILEKRLVSALLATLSAQLQSYLRSLPTLLPAPGKGEQQPGKGGAKPAASKAEKRARKEARKPRARAPVAFNLSVAHGPVGLQLARRQPDVEGCAQLVVEDVLADSVAADDGRAAAGMVLHRVGRTRATRLSVRDVQRRLLAATPDRRVTLSLLPAAAATCEAADDAIDSPDADGDGAAGGGARKRKRKTRRRKRSLASTS